MKTPLNAQSLKHHLTYNWWKYLLVLLAGTFLVDLLFTVTAPRIPEEVRVDFYVFGYADETTASNYMEQIRVNEMPEMESMTCSVSYPDETYGAMILATRVAAQEGDLYLLPREDFLSYASAGVFAPLEEYEDLMAVFNEAGVDLRRGWRTLSDSDETHLYGIPADTLPGLAYMCYAENGYLAVLAGGGNTENTVKFLQILCRDKMQDPEAAEAAESESAESETAETAEPAAY